MRGTETGEGPGFTEGVAEVVGIDGTGKGVDCGGGVACGTGVDWGVAADDGEPGFEVCGDATGF